MGWKQPNDERIAEIRRRVAELDTLIAKHDKTHAADLGAADTPEAEYWSGKREERRLLLQELHDLLKDGM